jgi:tetratricopeptide (TPR) repeat protein
MTAGVCKAENAVQISDSLAERADSLFHHFEDEQALDLYNRIIEIDPDYYPAWWRSSLLYARIGRQFKDENKKEQYYQLALKRAEQALKLRPDEAASHFVMGVAMGRKALIAGPRDRVAASREIKTHAEKALEADSSHAGAHHLLGRWHLEVTDLNMAERMAANWLFGGLPEGASMDKAVKHLRRATQKNPDFVIYWYDLGRAYHRMEKREKAIQVLSKALEITPKFPSEERDKEEARKLYRSLQ